VDESISGREDRRLAVKHAAALEINNVMIDPNIKTRFPGTQDITYLDTAAEALPPRDVPATRES
jgi:hypothetical protein